jgi:acetyl-CoA carboxylase carboxyl transferase subunit beta
MVDIVVHRHKLRETVARLCRLMMKLPPGIGHNSRGNGAAPDGNGAAGQPMVASPIAEAAPPTAS